MAKKELAFEASVDIGNGAKSIRTLKEEYKAAQQELNGLEVGTKAYVAQLEKLGKIKDNIGDLNAEIAAFNPEGKVQAFSNVVGGLASGFSAAQGAMALFGAEGEDLQRTLVKVQAGMAFAEGIKGLAGLKDGFVVLGNVLKANPILLIASIIAGIGTALFALKDKIKPVADAFEFLGDVIDTVIEGAKQFLDYIGLTNFALDKQRDTIIKNNEAIQKSATARYDLEIRELKRYGKDTETAEILRLKVITETNAAIIRQLIALGSKRTEEEQKRLDELTALNRGYYEDIKDLAVESQNKEKERQAKAYQDYLAHIEKYGRGGEVGQTMNAIQVGIQEQTVQNEIRTLEIIDVAKEEQARKDLEREQRNQDAIRTLKENAFEESKQFLMATQAISDLVFEHQLKQAQGNAAAERKIRKKQFQINKAFGIANSVIDGVQAVQKALNNPYPLNIILAAASGIMATANTVRIASTKFDDGGGAGGGGAISGNLGAAGGGVNISPLSTGSTLLNSDGSIKKQQGAGQQTVKAIVTETDITQTQKRVNSIEETSKIK